MCDMQSSSTGGSRSHEIESIRNTISVSEFVSIVAIEHVEKSDTHQTNASEKTDTLERDVPTELEQRTSE